MNGQKIDSLTIDKSCLRVLLYQQLFDWWYLLLNSSSNNTIQENLIPFGNGFSTSIDDFTPLVPLAQIYAGRYMGFKPKNTIYHQTVDIVLIH
jgi:hypothetical protein